jgi:hypothetical protein
MLGDVVAASVDGTAVATGSGVSVLVSAAVAELQLASASTGNNSNAIHHVYLFRFNTLRLASISFILNNLLAK